MVSASRWRYAAMRQWPSVSPVRRGGAGRAVGGLLRRALRRHRRGRWPSGSSRNSGVVTRHGVVNPLLEDVSGWSTERRMRRYLVEALPLGKEAVGRRARPTPGCPPATSACSRSAPAPGTPPPGWTSCSPGTWAWPPDAQRLFVGHMGCYAALPGLGAVADFVAARGRPALLLCAELTSLHVQPPARVDTAADRRPRALLGRRGRRGGRARRPTGTRCSRWPRSPTPPRPTT